jgi:Clostripain family
MRLKTTAAIIVAVFAISSMFVLPNAGAQGHGQNKWLFLLYLDADNSLDVNAGAHNVPVVQSDLDELMSIGSTNAVTAYALVDRIDGPAHLYKFNKGSMEEMKGYWLNGKEANMGDPATLRTFVEFTSAASPSDHTMLIFWDHGSPLSVASDDHATDAGGSDRLTQWEVVQALSGYKVDVIGADECNVGHMEVAYEYAMGIKADYLVAAETYTGWRGFPYDAVLRELTKDPSMTSRDAAVMLVEQTQLLLDKPPYSGERINSHAAIELANVPALAGSLKSLSELLVADMSNSAQVISRARGVAQYCYGANAMNVVDLQTFVKEIGAQSGSQAIKDAAATALANLDSVIVAVHATGSTDQMLAGLGIGFPDHSWELASYYHDFAFAGQGWLTLMESYWAAHGSV